MYILKTRAMICTQCGKDKGFWTEMTMIALYVDRDGKSVKRPVCYKCLGWETKTKK